jgi:hypothetical protein
MAAEVARQDTSPERVVDATRRIENAVAALVGFEDDTVRWGSVVARIFAAADASRLGGDVDALTAQVCGADPKLLANHAAQMRELILEVAHKENRRPWKSIARLLHSAGLAKNITDPKDLGKRWTRLEEAGPPVPLR